MIRALIFDCFGVLYRDNLSMLYDVVPKEQYRALRDIIHATDYGMMTREQYYQEVAELAKLPVEDIRGIESRQHSRDNEMIAYSQTFRPTYKVGLLSNIDTDSMNRIFPLEERSQLFDAFVISGEIGITKPSAAIFEHAATELGLLPEECLMIDDIPSNVEGARMTGMQALLFTTRRQLEIDLTALLEETRA